MGKVKSAKGKSKKITWKRIKHLDVDDFLVEKRRDERLGLSEKPDEELFQIDQLGFDDDYAQLAQKKKDAVKKKFSRQKDGPLVVLEDLQCFKILKPDSAVKDPVIKRNPILKGGLKKTLDMKFKDELRYYRQRETRSQTKAQSSTNELTDLWSTTGTSTATNSVLDNEWLTPDTKRNIIRNRSNWKPMLQKNEVAAVEVPHPGLSYNPSFSHHQQLLVTAVANVKAKLKQEQKIARATSTPKFEGDGTIPEVKDEEEDSEEDDDKSRFRKLPKPKTKQQKRKEKEQREREVKLKEQKDKAKKESEVFRVKTLNKQIKTAEAKSKARLEKKVAKKVAREKFGVRTLSKFKFEQKETQPLLSDELPKGLMGAGGSTATGELLLDRFKSLQKRNVIEPRMKHKQKRKNKPKLYIRDCDKMEWEKTGMWNGEKLSLPSGRRRPKVPQRKKKTKKFNK